MIVQPVEGTIFRFPVQHPRDILPQMQLLKFGVAKRDQVSADIILCDNKLEKLAHKNLFRMLVKRQTSLSAHVVLAHIQGHCS